jgi:hypothetical protein
MPDYSQAKVYMLKGNGLTYIGSTCQLLNQRLKDHRGDFNRDKAVTSGQLFEGNKIVTIELLEAYPCQSNDELKVRERYYIELNVCVNRHIPGRTESERYQYRTEHKRAFYLANKEAIQALQKAKTECPCTGRYQHSNRAKHFNTKIHTDYLATLQ